jgi:hypothetical protein
METTRSFACAVETFIRQIAYRAIEKLISYQTGAHSLLLQASYGEIIPKKTYSWGQVLFNSTSGILPTNHPISFAITCRKTNSSATGILTW